MKRLRQSRFSFMVTRENDGHILISSVCSVRNLRVEMDMYLWPPTCTCHCVYRYICNKIHFQEEIKQDTHKHNQNKRIKTTVATEASTTTTTKFK